MPPCRMPNRAGRKLIPGDLLFSTMAQVHSGYCSDETCTVALLGPVSSEQRLVYEIVKEAHDRGLDKIRPGVSCVISIAP
jgi:Xaa-Pro aminopeptidase